MASVPVKGIAGKKIVDISSGNQHSIMLDAEGCALNFPKKATALNAL